MADKVTWFELPADDTARAGAFYSEVFGWTMSDMGGGSLAAQSVESDESMTPIENGVINGDISPRSEAFDKPLLVLTVENIETKIEMVKAAGGTVALEPKKVEEMNMIWAIVTDTEGNNIGILQNL